MCLHHVQNALAGSSDEFTTGSSEPRKDSAAGHRCLLLSRTWNTDVSLSRLLRMSVHCPHELICLRDMLICKVGCNHDSHSLEISSRKLLKCTYTGGIFKKRPRSLSKREELSTVSTAWPVASPCHARLSAAVLHSPLRAHSCRAALSASGRRRHTRASFPHRWIREKAETCSWHLKGSSLLQLRPK